MASSDYPSDPRWQRRRAFKVVSSGKPRHRATPITHPPRRRRRGPQTPTAQIASRSRLVVVWGTLMLGGLGLMVNLFRLQVAQGPELQARANAQQTIQAQPFVPRRPIVDRNGDILAIDRPVYTFYVHPKLFNHSITEVAEKLVPVLATTDCVVTPHLGNLIELFSRSQSGIKVADAVTEEVANRLTRLNLDGLELLQHPQRVYPQQELAAEVIGYVDGELKGQAGVEYSQQNLLQRSMPAISFRRSTHGVLVPERLAGGFIEFDTLKLKLTLDNRLQRSVRSALKAQVEQYKAKRGAVIVMDAQNGSLLSLVSEPSYDPNQYYKYNLETFKNWVLTDMYEPGSTFKPLNVALALEAGVIKPDSIFVDEGKIFVEGWPIANYDYERSGGRGSISVTEIIKQSSNVGMVKIMQQMKPQDYYEGLKRFGIGETIGLDLPFEASSWLKSRQEFLDSPVERATNAFGQGFSITPIQLVRLMGALANGGKLITPHVVQGLYNDSNQPYWQLTLPAPQQIFSPETTRQVLNMMEEVVKNGTGKASQIPRYRIAGKTGTAQKASATGGYSRAVITSFVGIMPVEAPRYVILAIVDEPQHGTGGIVAAPIVKSVIEALIAVEKIPPSDLELID